VVDGKIISLNLHDPYRILS